jgi:hypothetical protein
LNTRYSIGFIIYGTLKFVYVATGGEGGACSVSRGGCYLADGLASAVARNKDSLGFGRTAFVRFKLAVGIELG